MGNLTEQNIWTEQVRQIEPGDSVIGGTNAPINLCLAGVNNRTLWLKTELAKAISSIGANKSSTDSAIALKADKARTISAGAGLTGGGDLSVNRTIGLAAPSTLSGSTTNWVGNGTTGHTHEIAKATPTVAGVAKLINALNSTATDAALTAAQGKALAEQIIAAVSNSNNRVAKSGDAMTGVLIINTDTWQKMQFGATGGNWRMEFDPDGSSSRTMNFNFNDDTGERAFIRFPTLEKASNQIVAYQSWVSSGFLPVAGGSLNGSLSIKLNNANKATLGVGASDVFLANNISNKYLQLKDDGTLSYANNTVSVNSYLNEHNLNDIKTAGNYGQRANAQATTERNYPIQRAGTLLVLPTAYSVQQVYIPFDETVIYRRRSSNDAVSAWHPWQILATAKNASLTEAGIVRLNSATNNTSETDAATPKAVKTAFDKAVEALNKANTKANLSDFAHSHAQNGYQKLPNGLILQWGKFAVNNDSYASMTFPIAFPKACFNVQAAVQSEQSITAQIVLSVHVGNLTKTGCSLGVSENGVGGQLPVYWFAIGN